jgi:hypothetical protein
MEVSRYTAKLALSVDTLQHADLLFADSCRFEHPRDLGRNDNRFAALQANESNSRNNYGRSHSDGMDFRNIIGIVTNLTA